MAQTTITVKITESDFKNKLGFRKDIVLSLLQKAGIPVSPFPYNRPVPLQSIVESGTLTTDHDAVTGVSTYYWTSEVPEAKKGDSVYASPVAQMILDAVKHERVELFDLLKQTIPHLRHRYTSLRMCLTIANTTALQMEYQQVKALIMQIKAVVDNFSKEEGEK